MLSFLLWAGALRPTTLQAPAQVLGTGLIHPLRGPQVLPGQQRETAPGGSQPSIDLGQPSTLFTRPGPVQVFCVAKHYPPPPQPPHLYTFTLFSTLSSRSAPPRPCWSRCAVLFFSFSSDPFPYITAFVCLLTTSPPPPAPPSPSSTDNNTKSKSIAIRSRMHPTRTGHATEYGLPSSRDCCSVGPLHAPRDTSESVSSHHRRHSTLNSPQPALIRRLPSTPPTDQQPRTT